MATYTPEIGDALSRVRMQLGDRDTTAPKYSDNEIGRALADTASTDFLSVYLATPQTGVDGATVQVRNGASNVELVLARTLSAVVVDSKTYQLSNGIAYDKMIDLWTAIQSYGLGWSFQLASKAEGEIVEWNWDYVYDLAMEPRRRAAFGRRSQDLAITGGALNVYGSTAAQLLSIYDVGEAVLALRRADALDIKKPASWSEGRVSESYRSAAESLAAGARHFAMGVFTRMP